MGDPENEGDGEPAPSASAFQAINRKSMAGDGEAPSRSSNVPSREASRGLAADDNHAGVNGRATSKSALSRLASPNPSTTGRTPVPEDSAQSGTITRRASTSSQMSSNQPVAPSYGTRSRRQPRGSRPNYAEDVDMDFEMQQSQANGAQSRAESLSEEPEVVQDGDVMEIAAEQLKLEEHERKKAERNAKRAAARAAAKAERLNGHAAINGESTPAAELSSSSYPRKRKAAAVATQNITAASQPAPPPAPATTNGKKAPANAIKPSSERETNMVTFEKCNAHLNKKGELVADDGTVFAPNGKLFQTTSASVQRCS